MKLKIFNRIYVPAFFILWVLQSIRVIRESAPFYHYTYSGFPLIWQRSPCCSLYLHIYAIPTLINIVFWGIAAYLVDKILMKLVKTAEDIWATLIVVWISGIIVFAYMCLIGLIVDIDIDWWYVRSF